MFGYFSFTEPKKKGKALGQGQTMQWSLPESFVQI